MKILLTLTAILCFLIVLITAYVWSGSYNVAATVPHRKMTHWLIGEVLDRSISAQSRGIIVPSLKDPKLLNIGLSNYYAMCRLCHGHRVIPTPKLLKVYTQTLLISLRKI